MVSGKVPYEAVVARGPEGRRSCQWRDDTCTKRGQVSRFYLRKRHAGGRGALGESREIKERFGCDTCQNRDGSRAVFLLFVNKRESCRVVSVSFLDLFHIPNFPQKEGKDFPNNSY